MDVPHARPIEAEIAEDTQCIRCGYNLRGLSKGGLCPECGIPIERSLRGDLLKYADPEWLEKLRFGVSLKLWNIVLSILLAFGVSILIGVAGWGQPLLMTTTWIGAVLGLWATFLITAQEPRISLQEDTVTLRTTIRFCAVAGFLGTTLPSVIAPWAIAPLIGAISGATSLISFVAWFGELLYLRRFATRLPDAKLAQTTGRLMWTLAAGAGALLVYWVIMLVASRTQVAGGAPVPAGGPAPPPGAVVVTPAAPGPAGLYIALGCAFGLAALFWFLIYVRVLIKYRVAFRQAAADARAVAASDGAE